MLRLDGNLIEANGTIPVYKIDPWVGFLQAYATRLAKEIRCAPSSSSRAWRRLRARRRH